MRNWFLGWVIFLGIVALVEYFSGPRNNSLTEEDIKEMDRRRKEEELEEKRHNDLIDAEAEMYKEKHEETIKRLIHRYINSKRSDDLEVDDDLPF